MSVKDLEIPSLIVVSEQAEKLVLAQEKRTISTAEKESILKAKAIYKRMHIQAPK